MNVKGVGLIGLMVVASGAQAAGFALIEQNGSGLGNAYAGQAAVAQDASTVFFNPAGMSLLEGRQIAMAAHYIQPSAEFTGSSTPFVALNGDNAGKPAFVPNAYYVMDLADRLKLGVGLNGPFGLATEYDVPWAGMTQALLSDLKTYNLNPSLAWRVSDALSVGVGLDWQRIEAELSSYNPMLPGVVTMKGDDDSWGWNLGVLYQFDAGTRVGVAFRSEVEHELSGKLSPMSVPIKAGVTLPAVVSASLFKQLSPTWDLLADVTWTGWSSFEELRVRHAANDATLSLVEENWDDAWRFSLGANYHADKNLTWRVGVAFDQTPVPDARHRTPRIPDQDRTWLAVGAQYRLSSQSAVDVGYVHIFVKDADIEHTENGLTLSGRYDNAVDVLSVQFTHRF